MAPPAGFAKEQQRARAPRVGAARVNSSGQATLNVSNLAVGSHSITAEYLGNATFLPSTSVTAADFSISAASTYTVLTTSANPAAPDGMLTLTARVAGVPTASSMTGGSGGSFGLGGLLGRFATQGSLPAGDVTFMATNTDVSGSTPFSLGSARVINGVGQLTILASTLLPAGDYSITAVFTPSDGNYLGSTSQAVAESVSSTLLPTSIHVSMSPRHGLAAGDPVTYTVTVNAKGASGTSVTPTGTVTLTDAVTGAILESMALTNGTATISTTFVTDPIIATYIPDVSTTGNGTYAGSQVILPQNGIGERGFGEGGLGGRLHDLALQSILITIEDLRGF